MLVLLLALTGCTRTASLQALKHDPMASVELPTALSVDVSQSPGGTALGIPAPAKIRRTFTVATGTVPQAISDLAEKARSAGWTLHPLALAGFAGDKAVDGRFLQIVIDGTTDNNQVWVELMTRA